MIGAGRRDGSIIITVSDRFNTVSMADLIVLVRGRTIDAGNHYEQLAAGGTLGELDRIQEAAFR